VAEQIDLLGGLLQDNRKQQRAVEDLARLWASQQELDAQGQRWAKGQQRHNSSGTADSGRAQTKAELEPPSKPWRHPQLLERQRLARSTASKSCAPSLQDDQPCPVCGSQEHPYHQPQALLQPGSPRGEEASAASRRRAQPQSSVELRAEVGGVNAQIKEFLQQQEQLAAKQRSWRRSEAQPLSATLLNQDADKRSAWLTQQLSS
jgi:exonuclease SbcC